MAAAAQSYDVIVLGGGVNGAGIARDCARRGIKVLLVEKNDLAKGASGANTGMIHGGIRYLRYDVHTTKMACTDSGYIQRIAPHLLFRIPFIVPVMKPKGARLSATLADHLYLEGAEIFFEAYDEYQPLKRGKAHTRLSKAEALALEPGLTEDILGAVTMDEWGIDPFRLVVENAIDAVEHGATVLTWHDVVGFQKDNKGAVVGVDVEDRVSGSRATYSAPVVVNATGAWGPRTAAMAGAWYQLRPGKGVHIVYSHRISNFGLVMTGVDGRQMFLMPHENGSIVGTTDDDYYGDLDNPRATEDEVKYILQAARVVFPAIDKYRMSRTYVGIRPTLWAWAKNEDRLSREHEFYDHAPQGVPGLISVAGGKLASYRQLAEEVTAEIARRVGNSAACTTHSAPLPGAEEAIDVDGWMKDLPKRHRLAVSRMAYRHGSRSKKILAVVDDDPRQVVSTCLCEPVCEAELRACIKGELVRRLVDVRRRTRQSMGACGGTRCAARTSQLLLEEAGLSPAEQLVELQGAMRARFVGKRPVLEGANLATEELNQAMHFLGANLLPAFQAARVACDDVAHRRMESAPADAPITRLLASKAPGVIVPAPLPEDRR
ncbi:MAG: glycerol-3-phosphate dehydrogenase/oxidase [Deltaproteobacteria bacterium]|nr:glycerol-3-phosphate dehydrogenase/oxidase [Deltaproteobacteria bacterium]